MYYARAFERCAVAVQQESPSWATGSLPWPDPAQGQPAQASVTPLAATAVRPFRRLTSAELLERRRQGFCFNCDEPYTPGHACLWTTWSSCSASAARVCRSWYDAVCEPELWRRVDMCGRSRRFRETVSLNKVTQLSIWFSAGQCREFFGQQDLDNDLLLFLADRAPLLKSLHLTKCCDVTSKGLTDAIKKFPLLEEFELCECERYDTWVFEVVAAAEALQTFQ
ncbi:uncharacterized protein LOC119315947 [Triticum dicoccoides]|uniref:uncharacterized protein LOC119315947 n=1 Tax=Triticum dicoccoides TaxID=85692 RepID=UPI001891D860|nr:uncharacterized protein LOC119315947 [Triticum dicoccoides]